MGHGDRFARDAAVERGAVTIYFRGQAVDARDGDTVAAALLVAGVGPFRYSPVSGSPRAPYCMMGACFECLVEIDRLGDQQACLVSVRDGMRIEPGDPSTVPAADHRFRRRAP